MNGRPWTEPELQQLRERYADTPTSELVKLFGRSLSCIYNTAHKLGLYKTKECIAEVSRRKMLDPLHGGRRAQFKKGHVAHNKGRKMPGWGPGRMKETQFKRGERTGAAQHNWKPIGTVLADGDGFLRIKVREGIPGESSGFGNPRVWPLLHRHNWELVNGPVPLGHALVFKDRNRENCDVENLELLTRAELLQRNSVHRWGPEVFEVIQLRGALNRQIRKRLEKQNV